MSKYSDYISRSKARHGDKFNDASLASQFIPYFENGARIEVTRTYTNGETYTRRGTVGATTGWNPAFLLMSRVSAHSSSDVLGPDDRIVKVVKR